MNWVSWSLSHIWWFVYEHCMNRFDIWSTKTSQITQNFWVLTKFEKYFIFLPVLYFCDGFFSPLISSAFFDKRNISNNLHTIFSFQFSICILSKSGWPLFHFVCGKHSSNNKKPIFFIKFSVFIGQGTTIYCVLKLRHLLLELLKSLTHFYNKSFFEIIIRSKYQLFNASFILILHIIHF